MFIYIEVHNVFKICLIEMPGKWQCSFYDLYGQYIMRAGCERTLTKFE